MDSIIMITGWDSEAGTRNFLLQRNILIRLAKSLCERDTMTFYKFAANLRNSGRSETDVHHPLPVATGIRSRRCLSDVSSPK
jgi:hypothetical protein